MRDCTLSIETYRESVSEGKKNEPAGSLRYKAYQIRLRIQGCEMNTAAQNVARAKVEGHPDRLARGVNATVIPPAETLPQAVFCGLL